MFGFSNNYSESLGTCKLNFGDFIDDKLLNFKEFTHQVEIERNALYRKIQELEEKIQNDHQIHENLQVENETLKHKCEDVDLLRYKIEKNSPYAVCHIQYIIYTRVFFSSILHW